MEDLKKIIKLKRSKSQERKPRYGMRKFSIGVVSCMLGYMAFVSPLVSATDVNTPTETPAATGNLSANNGGFYTVNYVVMENGQPKHIKPSFTSEYIPTGEKYNANPQKVDFFEIKGKYYEYLEPGKTLPANGDTKDNKIQDTASSPFEGTISGDMDSQDLNPEITLIYREVKSVIVRYEDEDGKIIKENQVVNPKKSQDVYNVTAKNYKLPSIDFENFEYKLVSDTPKIGSDPALGTFLPDEQVITYVYKKQVGSVVVKYVDDQGALIKEELIVKPEGTSTKETYETDNEQFKPDTFEHNGYEYKFVEKTPNSKDENGPVVEGKTVVEYKYKKLTGSVVVKYVDADSKEEIKDKQTPIVDASTKGEYNTATKDLKPTIIEKDGVLYKLKGLQAPSDPENGPIVEGTTTVTYEYEKVIAPVIVHYEDTAGTPLKDSVKLVGKVTSEDPFKVSSYDTTIPKVKSEVIESKGKIYKLEEVKTGSADEKGEFSKEQKEVTYVYREVMGSLVVTYVDENGEKIAADVSILDEVKIPTDYDTNKDELKPNLIEHNGIVYEINKHLIQPADEVGTVLPIESRVVTYVYKKLEGAVLVKYVDDKGRTLQESVVVRPEDAKYDTTTPELKPFYIEKNGLKYVLLRKNKNSDQEKGTVGANEQKVIVYVYSQIPTFVSSTAPGTENPSAPNQPDSNPTPGTENPPADVIIQPIKPVDPSKPTVKPIKPEEKPTSGKVDQRPILPKTGEVTLNPTYGVVSLFAASLLAFIGFKQSKKEDQ